MPLGDESRGQIAPEELRDRFASARSRDERDVERRLDAESRDLALDAVPEHAAVVLATSMTRPGTGS